MVLFVDSGEVTQALKIMGLCLLLSYGAMFLIAAVFEGRNLAPSFGSKGSVAYFPGISVLSVMVVLGCLGKAKPQVLLYPRLLIISQIDKKINRRYNLTEMKKSKTAAKSIVNRRASFDYQLGDELTVGIVLSGPETKAARLGHVQLKGSYVTINRGELWLVNASFSVVSAQRGGGRAVDSRTRKLLAHTKEIDKLAVLKKQGLTIVPKKLLVGGRFIKLIIATGRGKKRYDKRATIQQRETEREKQRVLKRI
jgi:SsrA-binding protein